MFLLVWRSEPLFHFSTQSRVLFLYGIQSRVLLYLVFRVVFYFIWCSEPYVFVSAFKVMFCFVQRSEPHLRSTFRATSSFGVQSHHHFLVWRSESHSQFRHSEPSSIFYLAFKAAWSSWYSEPLLIIHFGLQSHHLSSFRRSEPLLIFYLAFRAAWSSWYSEPLLIIHFGLQSHHLSLFRCSEPLLIFYLAFRAAWSSRYSESLLIFIRRSKPLHNSFRHSEPYFVSFGVQSHIFVSTFRSITSSFWHSGSLHNLFRHSGPHFQFDTQSPHAYLSFDLSPFSSILAFKAIVHTHSCILSHHLSMFWRSESLLLNCIVQGRSPWDSYSLALHILPSWLCTYPQFPHLVTLCLSPIRLCSPSFPFLLHMTWSNEFIGSLGPWC